MNYPGYTLVRREDCPEQHGVLTVLNHDVSGAAVLLVENEDTNKAFGIGFGTFPSDDTGVFHILEHSVLAGSEKYPVTSPFLQLLKSSMASFLNAMTFPDKTVYPFATPNETDFRNLMDVYLNAVFCPLAMVDKAVFEQEGWHRDADGTVSGVVYNEMQGALASPDAQLQNALERAMFPDTAYGFVSGGDPASIPALTYEKYQRVYRRHYSADNCCITLYGKMDMAEKLAFLDEHYLSRMPKGTSRPRLTVQDQQNGVRVHIPYYTENPEPDQVQCALAWYTGAFADRERQLGVEILLDALLGTNQSPLKAALLEQKLGADIDIGFDDSTLQPTLELVLRGATAETAPKFAAGVKQAVTDLLAGGIPEELLLASLTLQSPFMVLVVKLTADPNCFTSNLVNIGSRTALFILAAMATFMGTLNSYREICREREIILREASVGVSLPAVVLSKAAVLLLVEVLQAAILAFGFVSIVHVPQNHLLLETDMEIFITVLLTMFSSSCIGLLISALFTSGESAILAVLVLMIGQVVFSNIMFTVTGAAATISNIIVCRWGMGALGASTDLNSRMAWLQAGLDGPMYDATVENLTHSWQMLGLISVVCLVAAWLVLQIAFDKKKA